MSLTFLSTKIQENLIVDVVPHKLIVHKDSRGTLMETLRTDWNDVFRQPHLAFGQSYYSLTLPGIARDEDRWHVHPTKQADRFIVLSGNAIVALYDSRSNSKTHRVFNLFLMGENNGDDDQYLLFIPPMVLHGFCAVGDKPCGLLNFPTHLYDPAEEGRVPFSEVNAKLPDGTPFSWDVIRKQFGIFATTA